MYDTTQIYTVTEVSKILKCNRNYVYKLISTGLLPALKLGTLKVRKSDLDKFLSKYVGYDITDPENIKPLNP
ncbi:helix-turn-helix domain-containing protein [Fusibacter tunisiensis]|uniref:Excisionase family DNA binding protein n=1 Tax=Fusibacter tunisiensis TaxID=1008308 RepID=A0ABS2MTQ3_9FIRM|nr:helix-turn-helix domain-containing protein [Fusibacter tunisiensis]MBM7562730.1 excisionase family DNA binding protein [Fusibacter tunisiensis]